MIMARGKRNYEGEPEYGRSFTLAELEQFVAEARKQGYPPTAEPRVRILFKGGIKEIEVDDSRVVTPRLTAEEQQQAHEWFTTW